MLQLMFWSCQLVSIFSTKTTAIYLCLYIAAISETAFSSEVWSPNTAA